MIIWGSTTKDKIVDQGEFYCPQCRGHTAYFHHSVQQYFTLYFIPLFPTGTLAEFIQCQKCGSSFEPAVRELSAGQVEGLFQPWACPNCQNLNPTSEMRCLRCQTTRLVQDAPDQVPPLRHFLDQVAAPALPPRPVPSPSKKKARAAELWQQSSEPGRCRGCGVRNAHGDLRCRACGGELGVR
jgi:hypothetical protein